MKPGYRVCLFLLGLAAPLGLDLVAEAQAQPPPISLVATGEEICPCAEGAPAPGSASPPPAASFGGFGSGVAPPAASPASSAGAPGAPAPSPASASAAPAPASFVLAGPADNHLISKVSIRQDHDGGASGGILSLTDITAIYGDNILSEAQRSMVTIGHVASTSFMCMDDRVTTPSLSTPGGDLGEFILALASYLQERDRAGDLNPTQKVVDTLFAKYLESIPTSRPLVHCTDDRAIKHLEAELQAENLALEAPPEHVKEAGLLEKLTEVENQGDSHIRLMLKQPEWFQLNAFLVPMVLKSFYSYLWHQNQDTSSMLHRDPKLKLVVLAGQSNPEAFIEVSCGEICRKDQVAPMLAPRIGERSVLISHLDSVSVLREELATFFTRVAAATPRKINKEKLHQRLDRHGWLALETTGSRVAVGLPFYTLTYN